jgi:hypothetical protein
MIWVKALIFVDVAARVAAFVCCVGARGSRFYIRAAHCVLWEPESTRQGKKKHYSVKYGSIIKPGASLPFVTPFASPPNLLFCSSRVYPILSKGRQSQHTLSNFWWQKTGVSSSLSLSRSPWPPLGPVHGNLWLRLKVARSQAKPARKQNQFCLHARTNHRPPPLSRPLRLTI